MAREMADDTTVDTKKEGTLGDTTNETELKQTIESVSLDGVESLAGIEETDNTKKTKRSTTSSLSGIDDITSYIQKKKAQNETMSSELLVANDGSDLLSQEGVHAVVPHKRGDHKLVYLRSEAPADLIPDTKGRKKGGEYRKGKTKIYDVHADFAKHPTLRGSNGEPMDVWIVDSEKDMHDQLQAIRDGKGGGTNFLSPVAGENQESGNKNQEENIEEVKNQEPTLQEKAEKDATSEEERETEDENKNEEKESKSQQSKVTTEEEEKETGEVEENAKVEDTESIKELSLEDILPQGDDKPKVDKERGDANKVDGGHDAAEEKKPSIEELSLDDILPLQSEEENQESENTKQESEEGVKSQNLDVMSEKELIEVDTPWESSTDEEGNEQEVILADEGSENDAEDQKPAEAKEKEEIEAREKEEAEAKEKEETEAKEKEEAEAREKEEAEAREKEEAEAKESPTMLEDLELDHIVEEDKENQESGKMRQEDDKENKDGGSEISKKDNKVNDAPNELLGDNDHDPLAGIELTTFAPIDQSDTSSEQSKPETVPVIEEPTSSDTESSETLSESREMVMIDRSDETVSEAVNEIAPDGNTDEPLIDLDSMTFEPIQTEEKNEVQDARATDGIIGNEGGDQPKSHPGKLIRLIIKSVIAIVLIGIVIWIVFIMVGSPDGGSNPEDMTPTSGAQIEQPVEDDTVPTEQPSEQQPEEDPVDTPESEQPMQQPTSPDPVVQPQRTIPELTAKIEAQQIEARRVLNKARLLNNREAIKFGTAGLLKSGKLLDEIGKDPTITASELQVESQRIDLYIQQAQAIVE